SLNRFTKLKSLDVCDNSNVSGSTFSKLPASLEDLSACGLLTDETLKGLSHLVNLRILDIAGSAGVTGSTFSFLSQTLEELSCHGCGLNNDGIKGLRHFVRLKKADISRNELTEELFLCLPDSLEELICLECNLGEFQDDIDAYSTCCPNL